MLINGAVTTELNQINLLTLQALLLKVWVLKMADTIIHKESGSKL
jgi:hypothetical protein